jgi:hypothetical protein
MAILRGYKEDDDGIVVLYSWTMRDRASQSDEVTFRKNGRSDRSNSNPLPPLLLSSTLAAVPGTV